MRKTEKKTVIKSKILLCELLNLSYTNEHAILLRFAEFTVLEPIFVLLSKFQTWWIVCKFYIKMKLLASTFSNAGLKAIRAFRKQEAREILVNRPSRFSRDK